MRLGPRIASEDPQPLSARERLAGNGEVDRTVPTVAPVSIKPIEPGDKPVPGAPPPGTLFNRTAPDILGSFKTGGQVPKDGVYRLEKGERVLPTEEKEQRDSEYRRVYLARKNKK